MKIKSFKLLAANLILGLAASLLSSCSSVDSQAVFTSAAPRDSDTLVTPPGLTSPELTTNYRMNPVDGKGSYQVAAVRGMYLTTAGAQRWLVIESQTVTKVWPSVISYMDQLGLTIKYKNPAIGVIQSDWATRNNKVPQGVGIRGLFDWIGIGSMYSLNSMFMYRVTLWQEQNNVIVMVTNYQMDEEYRGCSSPGIANTSSLASSDQQLTKWMPRPSNPQLELEFLAQYMLFSGVPQPRVTAQLTQVESAPKNAQLIDQRLLINDQFDRVWWRTALALAKAGLGISDKNRSAGQYYVYPLQAQVDNPDSGFLSKWFGEAESVTTTSLPKPIYTVSLTSTGSQTLITMTPYTGAADKTASAAINKYLQVMAEQLQ